MAGKKKITGSLEVSGSIVSIEKPLVVETKNILWADLVTLRDTGELIPGQQYRITDYVTTTVQENTQSAGHQFDIIVVADDVNKLNENARACLHEGDTYFANSKLEAWKLKYCLDNDTSRFAWADEVNGKGVIYRMIDEFNNDVPYDFKNIQYQTRPGFTYNQWGQDYVFTRDASLDMIIADIQYYGYVGDSTPGGWSSNTCWLRDDPATTSSVIYNTSGAVQSPSGTITAVTNEAYDVYTFSKTTTTPEDFDVSLNGLLYSCYSNTIRPYVVIQANKYQVLNRITFIGWYTSTSYPGLHCYGNAFGYNCRNNTFGYGCNDNTFGNGCYNNTFGGGCYDNTFGDDCHDNTFSSNFSSNTFGNSCSSNTFGFNCNNNTLGNYCYSNTFGSGCNFNTFGDNSFGNTFSSDCRSNTFGNSCSNNTFIYSCNRNAFGNNCSFNTFNNNCYYNTFGNNCYYNTFGNSCYSNTFGNSCISNTFGDICYSNTFGNGCEYLQISDTSPTQKKYISVDNGFNGASNANKFDLYDPAILNKGYQVTFKKSASGKYLMLWATDTGTMTGKVKDSNTDNTWEDIA